MKSLWRRIGKKSLKLARRANSAEHGYNGSASFREPVAVNAENTIEETLAETDSELYPEEEEPQQTPAHVTRAMSSVRSQVAGSFDKAIPEEEEMDEESEEHAEEGEPEAVALAPATSEENIDDEDSCSYSYGTQFTFHGGLYGYPVPAVHRRLAAVPVIKGFTMTDVDFPLYFSSYDIPVVSASRHASFTRRHRLVRLHNRYTSMPAMRTDRPASRAAPLAAANGRSAIKVAPPAEADTAAADIEDV